MENENLEVLEKDLEKAKKKVRKAKRAKRKKERQGVFAEFKKFILRGNVVDMAIGVAVAGAFTAIVTAITKNVITPIVAYITGGGKGQEIKFVLKDAVYDAKDPTKIVTSEIAISLGPVLQAMLDFIIIAALLFTIMKIVTMVVKRTRKVMEEIKKVTDAEAEKEKAEAEEKAKAEAAAKEAELKAAAEAEKEAQRIAKEKQEKMYSDICAQKELLERIALSLEKNR